jgi:cell division septal protein FtsQ
MAEGEFHNPYFKKPSRARLAWQGDLWAYLGSGVLLLVLAIWLIVARRWLWIDYITISGNSYLSTEQVATATRQALQARRWLFIPQRFLPMTDETALTTAIRSTLEKTVSLQTLTVDSSFPNVLTVTLKEYIPGYVYIDGKHYYYVDRDGIVTVQVPEADIVPRYPRLRDRNKKRQVALYDRVVSGQLIGFIDLIVEHFTAVTTLDISEFAIPAVTCQTKEYVAEKIFADEIEGTADQTVKEQKRTILDRLQNKEITVDESLTLLEAVKRTESGDTTTDAASEANQAYLQWEAQYVAAPCDYMAVTHDVIVVTQSGVEVYFDSSLPLQRQLDNFVNVVQHDLNGSVENIQSIDLRYENRVYYQ